MARQDRANELDPTTERTVHSPGPERPAPASACVVVIHGEGLGRRANIHDAGILVGRSREADLCIDHLSVSREHCRIEPDRDAFRLTDLGATNTTLLNDQPVSQARLHDGDHITVGESILKFIGDASVEARYHEEVYQLATHDPLTNLYNRRHFMEVAEKEIARARRHGRPLVMGIIDVDLFKEVNDRYGHIAGDGVLARRRHRRPHRRRGVLDPAARIRPGRGHPFRRTPAAGGRGGPVLPGRRGAHDHREHRPDPLRARTRQLQPVDARRGHRAVCGQAQRAQSGRIPALRRQRPRRAQPPPAPLP